MLKEKTLKAFLKKTLKEVTLSTKFINIEEKEFKLKKKVWIALKKEEEATPIKLKNLIKTKKKLKIGDIKKNKADKSKFEIFNRKMLNREKVEVKFEDLIVFKNVKIVELKCSVLKFVFNLFLFNK